MEKEHDFISERTKWKRQIYRIIFQRFITHGSRLRTCDNRHHVNDNTIVILLP